MARQLGLDVHTVGKWRERFRRKRLEGLADQPRPGAPRRITDEQVEGAITRTLETRPAEGTHWSTRGLARELGLSQTAVSRIWRAFALQPHRTESFKLSADPFFVEKVRDIVGLYLNPPDRAMVLCVDEKSQVQALDRTQPVLPLRPGLPEHQTNASKKPVLILLLRVSSITTRLRTVVTRVLFNIWAVSFSATGPTVSLFAVDTNAIAPYWHEGAAMVHCPPQTQCQCQCSKCQQGDHQHCQNTKCQDQQCKQQQCTAMQCPCLKCRQGDHQHCQNTQCHDQHCH